MLYYNFIRTVWAAETGNKGWGKNLWSFQVRYILKNKHT